MIVRNAFNALLRPLLRPDMRDEYDNFEQEWNKFLKEGSFPFGLNEIELTTLSGLPRQVPLGETEPYTFVDPKMAPVITKRDRQFGLAFSISKEMMEDNKYPRAVKTARWLSRSVRLAQEHEAADLLDDAFTGAKYTGYNDEPLISATHSLLNSPSTWSNQITGNPPLSMLSYQALLEMGEAMVDQQGDPIPVRYSTLVISPNQEFMALQITQNPDEPFTANRNINAARKKRQLGYVVSHYKDQSNHAWFAFDPRMNDAHFLWKVRPQYPDWFEERIRAACFASRQRFLIYFYDPRGWIGSNAA